MLRVKKPRQPTPPGVENQQAQCEADQGDYEQDSAHRGGIERTAIWNAGSRMAVMTSDSSRASAIRLRPDCP